MPVKILAQLFLGSLALEIYAVAQQITGFLVDHNPEEFAGYFMVGRPHIPVGPALHVVDDLLVAVDGGILAVIVHLRINGGTV